MITRSDVTVVATGLPGWKGDAWHVRAGSGDYVVSVVTDTSRMESETLVFPATRQGKIGSFDDVVLSGSASEYGHEAAIDDLIDLLNGQT